MGDILSHTPQSFIHKTKPGEEKSKLCQVAWCFQIDLGIQKKQQEMGIESKGNIIKDEL